MSHFNLVGMIILLVVLVLLAAFFSCSETALMAINRYRLRHLARHKHKLAMLVQRLLERPDRLLGIILIGSTFTNILASSIATVIAVHLFGHFGVLFATLVMTIAMLIFGEVAPKTVAALHAQKLSFIVAWPLWLLLKIAYPLVWSVNFLVNGLLRLLCIHVPKHKPLDHLNTEELHTVVHEVFPTEADDAEHGIKHRDMLLSVLALNDVSVNDVMTPKGRIEGIDVSQSLDACLNVIRNTRYSRLPVFRNSVNEVVGILPVHIVLKALLKEGLNKTKLMSMVTEPYFIPENTPLMAQLHEYRKHAEHMGFVVDEYGDLMGLVTIEDILEEIVGELDVATSSKQFIKEITPGVFHVKGTVFIRDINRIMGWNLYEQGPKTISGLMIEMLEHIPDGPASLILNNYYFEILSITNHRIIEVKIDTHFSTKHSLYFGEIAKYNSFHPNQKRTSNNPSSSNLDETTK